MDIGDVQDNIGDIHNVLQVQPGETNWFVCRRGVDIVFVMMEELVDAARGYKNSLLEAVEASICYFFYETQMVDSRQHANYYEVIIIMNSKEIETPCSSFFILLYCSSATTGSIVIVSVTKVCLDIGDFQLLDLIITELKSHMTRYNPMSLIG